MKRFIPLITPIILLVLIAFAIFDARLCQAQADGSPPNNDLSGLKIEHPRGTRMPTPFPLNVKTGRVESLEFRAPESMTADDRQLADSAQSEIARRAGLQGFRLDGQESGWGYEQAVCPVFPDHLILEYSRNDGPGDVTLFSAVIPRGSEGHVRVIPVRRRGYSLFTPASSNALTLNDFNHMVKEGGTGLSPDWLRLSLCYAALAGGHVRAALQAAAPKDEHYPLLAPASLNVSGKGGATIQMEDSSAGAGGKHDRSEWKLIFAQDGRLLKVKRGAGNILVERPTVWQPTRTESKPTM